MIGGYRASSMISDAYATLTFNDEEDAEAMPMLANDVDVFYGAFTDDTTKTLAVNKSKIRKFAIDGIPMEVNTVECCNLSASTFLANNDVNITASCIKVDFSSDELTTSTHVSPCFWSFPFQRHKGQKIQPANTIDIDSYDATTCVRIAFKAFQLEEFEIEFSFANIDPTYGTIAASQKEKFDSMKDWIDSPFHEYQCNKRSNHYVIVKKHKKMTCAGEECTLWANKNCSHSMCKKFCVKQDAVCNTKGRKNQLMASIGVNEDIVTEPDGEMDDTNGA